MDGLVKIRVDLDQRVAAGVNVKGFNIVNVPAGLLDRDVDETSRKKIKSLMQRMINKHGTVFVMGAGDIYGEVSLFPQIISDELRIIAVGSVTSSGRRGILHRRNPKLQSGHQRMSSVQTAEVKMGFIGLMEANLHLASQLAWQHISCPLSTRGRWCGRVQSRGFR